MSSGSVPEVGASPDAELYRENWATRIVLDVATTVLYRGHFAGYFDRDRDKGRNDARDSRLAVRGLYIAVHVSRRAVRDFPSAVQYFPYAIRLRRNAVRGRAAAVAVGATQSGARPTQSPSRVTRFAVSPTRSCDRATQSGDRKRRTGKTGRSPRHARISPGLGQIATLITCHWRGSVESPILRSYGRREQARHEGP